MQTAGVWEDGVFVFNLRDSFAVHFCPNGVVCVLRSQLALLIFVASEKSIGFLYQPHQYWPIIKSKKYIQGLHMSDRRLRASLLSVLFFDDEDAELPPLLW